MVTQEKIAEKLNISRSTVSRALAGKNINPKTKELILKTAKEMGYVQNIVASSLATKHAKKIYAFIVGTVDEGYSKCVCNGINDAAKFWAGYNFEVKIIMTNIKEDSDQRVLQMEQFFDVINNQNPDGIIFSALSYDNMKTVSEICDKKNIPLMTLDMIYTNTNLCHVGPDYYMLGTYSAAYVSQLIMRKGTILTLTYDDHYEIGLERMRGFIEKLEDYPNINVVDVKIDKMNKNVYFNVLDEYLSKIDPVAIYAPYHVEYIAQYIDKKNLVDKHYCLIANGINDYIEHYLFNGIISGIVSARPYSLGKIVTNNFFKYFYRQNEMLRGNIDITVDIYIKENYKRFDDL